MMSTSAVVVVSRGMHRLLGWISFICLLDATTLLLAQEGTISQTAYGWTLDLLNTHVYVAWMLLTGLGALAVGQRWVDPAARYFVLASYSLIQCLFAWSIFRLTWNGSEAAIMGAARWMGYTYFAVMALIDRPHTPLREVR